MSGWNMPEGVNECRSCGVPIHWPHRICDDCEPPRDAKGRFVARPKPTPPPEKDEDQTDG